MKIESDHLSEYAQWKCEEGTIELRIGKFDPLFVANCMLYEVRQIPVK